MSSKVHSAYIPRVACVVTILVTAALSVVGTHAPASRAAFQLNHTVSRAAGREAVANAETPVYALTDGGLYALDAATGAKIWRVYIAPSEEDDTPNPAPLIHDGMVYVTSGLGQVYAIDARSGAVIWMFKTGCCTLNPLAISGGMLFVSASMLYALNAATGKVLWSGRPGLAFGSIVAGHGVLYAVRWNRIVAINVRSGVTMWVRRMSLPSTPRACNLGRLESAI